MKKTLFFSLLLLIAVLLNSCGHVHDIVIDPEVAPTCAATGKTEGAHCSSCGEVIVKQKEIPMVAHNIEKTGCTTCDLKASEGLEYVKGEFGTYVKIGTCADEEVIIPAYAPDGTYVYSVSFEGENAKNVKSIIFMEGREDLRAKLFCPNLENIVFNEGIKKIYRISGNLPKLKSISIPETCVALDSFCFYELDALEKIDLPKYMSDIGYLAFKKCYNLKEINIPEYLSIIQKSAFSQCSSLEKITLPASTYQIEKRAFSNCEALKEITFNTNVYIDEAAFYGCIRLENIYYPTPISDFLSQSKHENWYEGMSASTKIVCTDGEISIYAYKQMINQTPED